MLPGMFLAASALGLGDDKSYRGTRKRLRKSIRAEQRHMQPHFAAEEDRLKQALGQHDVARAEAGRVGRASKQQALDREQQLMGQLSSGLASSGLSNTTGGLNARRGVAADTTRRLQDVDSMLGQLFSNLAIQKGGAFGDLAGFERRKGDYTRDVFGRKQNIWANYG